MSRRPIISARLLFTFLALTSLLISSPAIANEAADYEAVAGKWLFGSEATGKGCVVTLTKEQTIGGRTLQGAAGCTGPLAVLSEAFAWDFGTKGGVVFRDATRKTLIGLIEDEDATYFDATKPPGQRLVLVPANEGQERLIVARDMAGSWQFRRPGGAAICAVTFSLKTVPSAEEFYALTVDPACDPGLKKLKLAKWHVEAALLVLVGSETGDLSLVPKANGSFVKATKEGGKPLELVRK